MLKEYKFTPNFLQRIFDKRLKGIKVSHAGIFISEKGGNTVIPWENRCTRKVISKGLIFHKLEINSNTSITFLSEKLACQIQNQITDCWFSAHHEEFSIIAEKLNMDTSNKYIRSSKLYDIEVALKKVVSRYSYPSKNKDLKSVSEPYIQLFNISRGFDEFINRQRDKYIENEINQYSTYFDEVETNPLTDKQRIACVTDDESNLVLAGAGTGKTSTMVAKAGYLLKSGKAKPKEILLLAYGNKAAKELDERIKDKLDIDTIKASTFHSLGKSIVSAVEGKSKVVSKMATDERLLEKFVDDQLQKRLSEDEAYKKLARNFFTTYLYPEKNIFDFKTLGEYYNYLKNTEYRTLKGELVKGYQELVIANYLYTNGIEYQYEEKYEIDLKSVDYKSYIPDFYLPGYKIYIEHYGVDKDGNTAPSIDKYKYTSEMAWKRETHRRHDTLLIESYHYQWVDGNLLENLEKQLEKYKVKFEPIPDEEIFDELRETGELTKFSILLTKLMKNIKNCCLSETEIEKKATYSVSPYQTKAALQLLKPIINAYNSLLEERGEVDFDDMISKAIDYLQDGKFMPKWKYILVDEFQDISEPRARIINLLKNKVDDASLFCVGDDWQSIYQFSGSDLSFTTNFEELFGLHSTVTLDKTFRFNSKINEFASRFVSENPSQVTKHIASHVQVDVPCVSVYKSTNCCDIDEIRAVLNELDKTAKEGSTVFILTRFTYLIPDGVNGLSKEYPKLNVEKSMTMHASKGKEADYVIIIGLEKGKHGFPSEKITHPLLEVYLPKKEVFFKAEERRLFYVALTRARHKVFILANPVSQSVFYKELINKKYELTFNDFERKNNNILGEPVICAKCKEGNLTKRESEHGQFIGCSNFPYCKHTEPGCARCGAFLVREGEFRICTSDDCNFKSPICPQCDGNLKQRTYKERKFWGCTNYNLNSSHSCSYTANYIDLT